MATATETSFPRQYARTRHFSLGVPRHCTIAPDGGNVVFLRSRSGSDPTSCCYRFDVASGAEYLLVDPDDLAGIDAGALPAEELARRERTREQSSGIVAYSADESLSHLAFSLGGRLFVASVPADSKGRASVTELDAAPGVLDPHLDPTGRHVAYVSQGSVRVIGVDGAGDRVVCGRDPAQVAGSRGALDEPLTTTRSEELDHVSYGLAEFVAAEEMGRTEGMWWSPDGSVLIVERVDTAPIERIHIADPAVPQRAPRVVAYPRAGTANASVGLWCCTLEGPYAEIGVDWSAYEYLVAVHYGPARLLVSVQSRDQRRLSVLEVDPATGATTPVFVDDDEDWCEIVPGSPSTLSDGTLVLAADRDGARRLFVGDAPVTPTTLQVRSILGVDADAVLFSASSEPTEIGVYRYAAELGIVELATDEPGVSSGLERGGTAVITHRNLSRHGTTVTVRASGMADRTIASAAETPVLEAHPHLRSAGAGELRTAICWPTGYVPGSGLLPVLLDPYGGPHAQRVLAARDAYLVSQWFADQGFAVVITDGRGTPGRGSAFERSIRGDFATPVLEDQVAVLEALTAAHPDLDRSRVAIRGWSFGGYLAALAVLRRPDVFHVGVAGAPVTEHRYYDTHYMERYLGHPDEEPENYDRCSLIGDAARLSRPLLVIHGLADDNVLVAHSLALSSALLAAGKLHSVLPLSGVTHMTPQEVVAENLLRIELDFINAGLAR